jgi:hypothetical protein
MIVEHLPFVQKLYKSQQCQRGLSLDLKWHSTVDALSKIKGLDIPNPLQFRNNG